MRAVWEQDSSFHYTCMNFQNNRPKHLRRFTSSNVAWRSVQFSWSYFAHFEILASKEFLTPITREVSFNPDGLFALSVAAVWSPHLPMSGRLQERCFAAREQICCKVSPLSARRLFVGIDLTWVVAIYKFRNCTNAVRSQLLGLLMQLTHTLVIIGTCRKVTEKRWLSTWQLAYLSE